MISYRTNPEIPFSLRSREKMKSRFRYLRYAFLFFCCYLLLVHTDEVEEEANDPKVAIHNAEIRQYDRLVESVQHVPPMQLDKVDPEKPVYFIGTLKRRSAPGALDDPTFGVSFGDCVGGLRWMAYDNPEFAKPEKLPEGLLPALADLPDKDIRFETLLPEGGVELLGFDVDQDLLAQFMSPFRLAPLFSKQPDAEDLAERFQPPSFDFEKSELSETKLPMEKKWGRIEAKGRESDQTHALFLTIGDEPAVKVKVIYDWHYPKEVHFLGGIKDGRLVAYEGIGKPDPDSPFIDTLYFLSAKPIDVRDKIESLVEGPIRFDDQLGDEVVETPPAPLPYARDIGKAGALILTAISILLFFLAPPAQDPKKPTD